MRTHVVAKRPDRSRLKLIIPTKYEVGCPHCNQLIDLTAYKDMETQVKAAAGKRSGAGERRFIVEVIQLSP